MSDNGKCPEDKQSDVERVGLSDEMKSELRLKYTENEPARTAKNLGPHFGRSIIK